FFFQAEDGIRYWSVTGVQTCALPIFAHVADDGLDQQSGEWRGQPELGEFIRLRSQILVDGAHVGHLQSPTKLNPQKPETHVPDRSEERRVGKECRSGWARYYDRKRKQ